MDNNVHYAEPTMRVWILSRLDLAGTYYLRQEEELAHFAQLTEIELKGLQFGKDVVNVIQQERRDH